MGGLVGLPLGLRGLERAAGGARDPRLLAFLVARLLRLLRRCTSSSWGYRPILRHLWASGPRIGHAVRRHGLRQPRRWDTVASDATAVQVTAATTAAVSATAAAGADRHGS